MQQSYYCDILENKKMHKFVFRPRLWQKLSIVKTQVTVAFSHFSNKKMIYLFIIRFSLFSYQTNMNNMIQLMAFLFSCAYFCVFSFKIPDKNYCDTFAFKELPNDDKTTSLKIKRYNVECSVI